MIEMIRMINKAKTIFLKIPNAYNDWNDHDQNDRNDKHGLEFFKIQNVSNDWNDQSDQNDKQGYVKKIFLKYQMHTNDQDYQNHKLG